MKRNHFLLVYMSLVITWASGCASIPREQLANADFGAPPEFYQDRIKAYFQVDESTYGLNVKPDWRFEQPFKAAYKPDKSETWQFGYGIEMRFNRKRRYQGYTFGEKHMFFMHDKTLKHVNAGDKLHRIAGK